MSDRPTIEIELGLSKKKVVIREWITGEEYETMQEPVFRASEEKTDPVVFMKEVVARSLEAYVVSVDGKTEDIAKAVRALPYPDYNEVIKKINELKKKD